MEPEGWSGDKLSPVVKEIAPDEPVVPPLVVRRVIAPEVDDVEYPEVKATVPPVEDVVSPPVITVAPPAPSIEFPVLCCVVLCCVVLCCVVLCCVVWSK